MAAAPPSLADLPAKFTTKPKPKSFSLNSRYLMIHYLFNVLGEAVPRNLRKGMLPKIDAASLEKMKNPFAPRLLAWRSKTKAVQSLQGALGFVKSSDTFAPSPFRTAGQTKGVFRFLGTGYDNVERIFTMPKRSIPLNLDKSGRAAFVVPSTTIAEAEVAADPRNLDLLAYLAVAKDVEDDKPSFEDETSDEGDDA